MNDLYMSDYDAYCFMVGLKVVFYVSVVIGFIAWILSVILFFKIWGMCNNVKCIKNDVRSLKNMLSFQTCQNVLNTTTAKDTTNDSSIIKVKDELEANNSQTVKDKPKTESNLTVKNATDSDNKDDSIWGLAIFYVSVFLVFFLIFMRGCS